MDFVEGCKRLARNDHEFYQWAYAAGHQHLTIEDFLLDLARKLEDDDCERQSSATRFGVRNVQDDETARKHANQADGFESGAEVNEEPPGMQMFRKTQGG